ncbi:MAG: hypothetical protein EHM72_16395, partial [Calditrichaeota bacterium]
MNVLIAYSSGYGTTREIAEKIAGVLGETGGLKITLQSIDDIEDIKEFDAVIVGSSVRAERPLANVRDFFARNSDKLAKKKVAIFAVCLTANSDVGRDKVKNEYISHITDKYPAIIPISIEAFGGKIDFDRLNPVMQQLMRSVLKKTGVETSGTVDTRDWEFI